MTAPTIGEEPKPFAVLAEMVGKVLHRKKLAFPRGFEPLYPP